ncbi:eCIS core domain-containing protein [Planktothrix mougeotii]|uniref:eCIS core domain-containing protein n=1 Tax=Planktothrix mougeotii TaxID=54306 RepID=UPI0004BC153D|nr:DUF4157 domain-containing protein [Planktothrix mougeotii]
MVKKINTPSGEQSTSGQGVQRQEEEDLQMKPDISSIQRQEGEEEDLQMKPDISSIQRQEGEEEIQAKSTQPDQQVMAGGDASTELETSIQTAKGGGQPLDGGLQRSMGQAMGADFSGVKVHTDSQSDQLNQSIQAKAFTTGQDVFFRQGAYEPSSRGGQELIAHELTHVVQQNGKSTSGSSPIQRKMQFESKDLKGEMSLGARVNRFLGRSTSTFTQIQNLLTKYETANAPKDQKELLEKLRTLAQSWLDKHTDDPQKRASLEKMIPAIDQEIIKLASDQSYLDDLKNKDKFKFLTTSGQEASDLSGVHEKVKKNAESSGLTQAELTAIRVYTAQDYAYMNPILAKNKGWLDFKIKELVGQGQINLGNGRTKLNDKERIQVQQEANRHSDKAVEGLKKLPDIKREVYRGVGLTQQEFKDQYKPAATVTFPSFSSTSLDRKVSRSFATREAQGGKVGLLLIMQVTKGKDIGDLSLYQKEKEVLLAPNATFKVDKIIDKGKNTYEVNLHQVN